MGHRRHEAHDQADAAEVGELHRALEVEEAVVAGLDRTPDRTPGVVYEHIAVAVLVEHLLPQPVAVGHVRQVRRVGEYLAACRLHLVARLEPPLLASRHAQRALAGAAHALSRPTATARQAARY